MKGSRSRALQRHSGCLGARNFPMSSPGIAQQARKAGCWMPISSMTAAFVSAVLHPRLSAGPRGGRAGNREGGPGVEEGEGEEAEEVRVDEGDAENRPESPPQWATLHTHTRTVGHTVPAGEERGVILDDLALPLRVVAYAALHLVDEGGIIR
eukprot:3936553-Rhodomonas_salina.1